MAVNGTISKTNDRNALKDRILAKMHLSDGSAGSKTAPPAPMPEHLSQCRESSIEIQGERKRLTGGAGTLALECSRALLEHGLSGLAILDINPVQSAAAISALQSDFPSAKIVTEKVNVADAKSVGRAMDAAKEQLGSVDMLCCFAGVVQCTKAQEIKPEEWDRVLGINTGGSMFCAQAAFKHMKAQGTGGSILFIASISAHRVKYPQPQASYNVSKSGVLQLKSTLAAEWAHYGIRVNSISPGYMDTILNEGSGLVESRRVWAERNPIGRMGSPQELTAPVVMLCSEFGGSYLNGADIVVDGGGLVF